MTAAPVRRLVVARTGTVFAATGSGWESLLSGEDTARVPARACGFTPDRGVEIAD
jgi:hypothetical protein